MTAGLLAVALPLGVAGCSADEEDATLRVLAAASLTTVFTELGEEFEASHDGVTVKFSFGSSTELAQQAADGAPGDVLATADEHAMTIATDADVATSPTTFATNVLVIVTPPDNPGEVGSLADLADTTWVRCADQAPCGGVARALLEDNEITAEPSSLEEDVRATLDKVISGEADAGLVYATDAAWAGDDVATVAIDGADSERNLYLISPLEQSLSPELAEEWIDLVTGPDGQRILAEAGFARP